MKIFKRIILAILILMVVAICAAAFYFLRIPSKNKQTNLVINYTNVTGKMKGSLIVENGEVYFSEKDIQNYFDKDFYLETSKNYLIAAENGVYEVFDISSNTVTINDEKESTKIINQDGMYYVSLTELGKVYNFTIDYKESTDTYIVSSTDKDVTTAVASSNLCMKKRNNFISRATGTVKKGETVYVVPNTSNVNYGDWTKIRSEDGEIGFVKSSKLTNMSTEESKIKKEENTETISLAWEFFTENSSAPQNDSSVTYEGVNVVSPTFFKVEGTTVKENVGINGISYISWAKSKNYKVWAVVSHIPEDADDMKDLSNTITDYDKRQTVIAQIVNYAKKYNLDGINLDFENMYQKDVDSFSRFVIELKPRLENIGVTLSVDVTEPDGSENWSLCYDRNTLGDVADYLVFMAYDQTPKTSKSVGTVAGYNWVERNLKKFIENEEVDSNKIILGIPLYTRLWIVDSNGSKVDVKDVAMKNEATYISQADSKDWLEAEQQYFIQYTNKDGNICKMWIEDETSISQKLNLISQYNLSGAAFWQKGYEDYEIFSIVKEKLLNNQ